MNTGNGNGARPERWYREHFLNVPAFADLTRRQVLERQSGGGSALRRIQWLALSSASRLKAWARGCLDRGPRPEGTVSHRYKCIFVHIPKTAGRSIAAALEVPWGGAAHRTFRSYRRTPALREYFSFSVVRNPWDRFVSIYHHVMKAKVHDGQAIRGPSGSPLPFASWLAYNYDYYKGPFPNRCDYGGYNQSAGAPFWFTPQKNWLVDESGQIAVDRVVRFENLEEGVGNIITMLGVGGKAIPWMNRSERLSAGYRDYYDERTKDIVAQLAADDIEAFGYLF